MSECTHCYGTKSLRIIRNGIHCGMKDCDYCSNDNKKQSPVECLLNNLLINGFLRLTQQEDELYKQLKEQALQMEREEKEKLFDAVQAEIRQINNLYPHIYQGRRSLTELSLNIAYLKNNQ